VVAYLVIAMKVQCALIVFSLVLASAAPPSIPAQYECVKDCVSSLPADLDTRVSYWLQRFCEADCIRGLTLDRSTFADEGKIDFHLSSPKDFVKTLNRQ